MKVLLLWCPGFPIIPKQESNCHLHSSFLQYQNPTSVEEPEIHSPGLRGGDSVRKVLALHQGSKFDPQHLFLCTCTCAPHHIYKGACTHTWTYMHDYTHVNTQTYIRMNTHTNTNIHKPKIKFMFHKRSPHHLQPAAARTCSLPVLNFFDTIADGISQRFLKTLSHVLFCLSPIGGRSWTWIVAQR